MAAFAYKNSMGLTPLFLSSIGLFMLLSFLIYLSHYKDTQDGKFIMRVEGRKKSKEDNRNRLYNVPYNLVSDIFNKRHDNSAETRVSNHAEYYNKYHQ